MQLLSILLLAVLLVIYATPGQTISWEEIRHLATLRYFQRTHHKYRINEKSIKNIQQLTANSEKFDAIISTTAVVYGDFHCKGIAYRFPESYLETPLDELPPKPERKIEILNLGRCTSAHLSNNRTNM
uniref:Uncharacterized protein n=1 Tax=Cacopsylla melanoneura TaxID=428564 RepID=A0A8D8QHJ7_9HEMI